MINILLNLGLIGTSIYLLYNILKDKSKDRDNKIKIGMLILFFIIILKFIV